MRHWGFAIALALLFALIYSQLHPAVPRVSDPRPDLVAVVNMTPANPLGAEIWLIGLDGRLLRRITNNNHYEDHPRFSPDGSKIAFVRNMGVGVPGGGVDLKQNEIFVYDLRSGKETRLTRNDVEDAYPEWCYDGKSIVFFSRRGDPKGRATLWVMRADGSSPRQITHLGPGELSHLDPNWSPDGNWLAFVSFLEKMGMLYSRVEKVRLDGTQRTVVSSGGRSSKFPGAPDQESWGDLDPTHSPDGAMIWSARRFDDGRIHLYSFGAGAYYPGKTETDMSWPPDSGSIERAPSFSPDGRRLVLTRVLRNTGARTRQLVLTDARSSFRRYLISRDDWDVWDAGWHPFAESGAERDDASVIMRYNAGPVPKPGAAVAVKNGDHPMLGASQAPKPVQLTLAHAPSGPKADGMSAYEARWKLEVSPQRVLSMTLRFQGKLSGAEKGSLAFQLMDWETKNWVEVFAKLEIPPDEFKIVHEFSPANFINRETREVALRLVLSGASTAQQAPALDFDLLRLDVRRD